MPIMLSLIHVFKPLPPLSLLPSVRRVQKCVKNILNVSWLVESEQGDKHDKLLRLLQTPCFYHINQV